MIVLILIGWVRMMTQDTGMIYFTQIAYKNDYIAAL